MLLRAGSTLSRSFGRGAERFLNGISSPVCHFRTYTYTHPAVSVGLRYFWCSGCLWKDPTRRGTAWYSSTGRGRGNRKSGFKLDALAFKVSPDEALAQFQRWAMEEQGLRYLLNWSSVRIGASYVPVWSFDVNARFVTKSTGQRRYDLKPEPFTIYRNNEVVHLPGVSAYAGHEYRRSLINPIHNTTLVFMGDKTVPFGSWMLRDMKMRNGETIAIFPDPWNATKSRAFQVVVEELEVLAEEDAGRIGECKVETEMISARRVYMPTFVIDYKVLGGEFQAFVSGCDSASGVSGVSHRTFPFSNTDVVNASNSFLNHAQNAARLSRNMGTGPLILMINLVINIASRLLSRIPIISLFGAGFVAFRKIFKPWYDNRSAGVEWERQREHEAYMKDHWEHTDDFVDRGSARRFFTQNREQILKYLSGENVHDEGDYDWYRQWEEWARAQYEKQQAQSGYQQQQYWEQQRQQQHQQRQQQQQWQKQDQQQQQRTTRAGAGQQQKKKEFVWDFNPNDPYSVLGIKRGATKSEVSQAFRREMLKFHPDTNGSASEAEKERALERSKLITAAYRKIKTQMK